MYICLCHGFTDKQVRGVIAEGRRSTSEIYARLGCRPRCGKCVPEVRALVGAAGHAGAGGQAPERQVCAAPTE